MLTKRKRRDQPILKADSDDVLEITGEYSGSCGSIGPTHERGDQAYGRML